MPATAILNLRALNSGPTPRSFHCLMHPLFLQKIAVIAPLAGAGLHDNLLMSAFSISPVMGVRNDKIAKNQSLWTRISLLTDEMEGLFIDTLEKGLWGGPLRLAECNLAVESVAVGPQVDNPWSGRDSFEALQRRSAPNERVCLKIESPMAFKRGDLHYPLPDPTLTFKNLLRRWNLVAPFQLPDVTPSDNVSYSFVDIKTKPYPLRKGGTIYGFMGHLVFVFKTNPSELSYFNLLLNFAFYAGIGVKTSQGMGMCRVMDTDKSG